ncbi:thioesterase domain-containing protein [Pseudomonas entomophila]|uniref:thioesterase II family protein n=1 Tax=Pseudomonas entomophila TaxID=312306 RepID=UPI0023D89310|nr:thioesterase domain-containing protein [Pseudomonas entomophila]MDF0732203.1 thioesterase domain-containing protein [Pseudomonas entomophila]
MTVLRPCLRAEQAEAHLLLCPFAGGSGGAFHGWRGLEHLGLDLTLAIYPGRDQRMHEPCARQVWPLAEQLAETILALPATDVPLLLAGHSMGAQVAFETCLLLEQAGAPPDGLVLSACHAPHLTGRRLLSHLDDTRFIEQLVAIGGCSETLRQDAALLQVFMPLLRADFQATEGYHRALQPGRPNVRTPTLLLHGSHDAEASADEVAAWAHWLDGPWQQQAVAGDHFYLTQRPRAFASHLHTFIDHSIRLFQP